MTLEEQIADQIGQEIVQGIDDELIVDMMIACGWTRVPRGYYTSREQAVDMSDWLDQNCAGSYKKINNHMLFDNQHDAVLFSLRWL